MVFKSLYIRKSISLMAVLAVGVSMTSAAAQVAGQGSLQLVDRIARIESAVQDLQGVVFAVDSQFGVPAGTDYGPTELPPVAAGPVDAANLSVRVSQTERSLQLLTGRLEELAYRLDQQGKKIDALSQALSVGGQSAYPPSDINSPLPSGQMPSGLAPAGNGTAAPLLDTTPKKATGGPSDLVTGNAPASTGVAPQAIPVVTQSSIVLPETADATYDMGFTSLLSGDYDGATAAFKSFVAQWPDDPRSADAQFRLGEIYLATKAYPEAASAFLAHIKKWPNDSRAPESYLKLGTAFAKMGKNTQACKVFGALRQKYPNASQSVLQRLASERAKAQCS